MKNKPAFINTHFTEKYQNLLALLTQEKHYRIDKSSFYIMNLIQFNNIVNFFTQSPFEQTT